MEFAAWYEETFGLPELEDRTKEALGRETAATRSKQAFSGWPCPKLPEPPGPARTLGGWNPEWTTPLFPPRAGVQPAKAE